MVRCLPADAVRARRLGDSLRRTGGRLANDSRRLVPTSHRSRGAQYRQGSMDEFAGIRAAAGSRRSTLRRGLGTAGHVRSRRCGLRSSRRMDRSGIGSVRFSNDEA